MSPFWVYMLFVGNRSHGNNRKIYTGYTRHLASRIAQHSGLTQTKGARLTRKQPIELVYLEQYPSQKKAMHRERQLKHESPFNQKKYKLKLIEEFHTQYGHLVDGLNEKLVEHFEFLDNFAKTIKIVEKELITQIKTSIQ